MQPMSFDLSSLRDALGIPSTKVHIDGPTFASYIIPPILFYIVIAILAVTPRARVLRVALWPLVTLLAFRAAVCVDMSNGDPNLKFLNMDLGLLMLYMSGNSLSWMSAEKPLVRYLRPANSSPSVFMDAFDLATSLRGHGWEWSRGMYIPRETRPTNRIAFACYALLSGTVHGFMTVTLHTAIEAFTPNDPGSSIFDDTLPFPVRYLRANIIGIMGAFSVYAVLQSSYDMFTVFGIVLLGQDPAQWPPAFDSPWLATSLNEFWGRRWHQMFRHSFLLGAYPFTMVLGRAGTVIGAFLSSGLHHHIMMITIHSELETWKMFVSFGMMALGIFAERTFYRYTGRKVGGVVGWIWSMAWLLLWGNMIIDGFARVGMFAPMDSIQSWVPFRAMVQKLVIDFNAWLHTV